MELPLSMVSKLAFWYLYLPGYSDCSTESQDSAGSRDATGSKLVSFASSSSSTIICRTCQDVDKKENLKTLCQRTGSIAKYHVSCLEKWLSVSNTDICELCHKHFTTKRKPRPFKEVCLTFRDGFCFTHAKISPLVAGLETPRKFGIANLSIRKLGPSVLIMQLSISLKEAVNNL